MKSLQNKFNSQEFGSKHLRKRNSNKNEGIKEQALVPINKTKLKTLLGKGAFRLTKIQKKKLGLDSSNEKNEPKIEEVFEEDQKSEE